MKKKIRKLETKNEDNLLNSGNKFKKIPKFSNCNREVTGDWGGHFEILKINTKVIDQK
jgi:hypothetical protein